MSKKSKNTKDGKKNKKTKKREEDLLEEFEKQKQESQTKIKESIDKSVGESDYVSSEDDEETEWEKVPKPIILHKKIYRLLYKRGLTTREADRHVILSFEYVHPSVMLPELIPAEGDEEHPGHCLVFCFQHINLPLFQPLGTIFYYNSLPVEKIFTSIKAYMRDLRMCRFNVLCTVSSDEEFMETLVNRMYSMYVHPKDYDKEKPMYLGHVYCPHRLLMTTRHHFQHNQFAYYDDDDKLKYADMVELRCLYTKKLRDKKITRLPPYLSPDIHCLEESKEFLCMEIYHDVYHHICHGQLIDDKFNTATILHFFIKLYNSFGGDKKNALDDQERTVPSKVDPKVGSEAYEIWKAAIYTLDHICIVDYYYTPNLDIPQDTLKALYFLRPNLYAKLEQYSRTWDEEDMLESLNCDVFHLRNWLNIDKSGNEYCCEWTPHVISQTTHQLPESLIDNKPIERPDTPPPKLLTDEEIYKVEDKQPDEPPFPPSMKLVEAELTAVGGGPTPTILKELNKHMRTKMRREMKKGVKKLLANKENIKPNVEVGDEVFIADSNDDVQIPEEYICPRLVKRHGKCKCMDCANKSQKAIRIFKPIYLKFDRIISKIVDYKRQIKSNGVITHNVYVGKEKIKKLEDSFLKSIAYMDVYYSWINPHNIVQVRKRMFALCAWQLSSRTMAIVVDYLQQHCNYEYVRSKSFSTYYISYLLAHIKSTINHMYSYDGTFDHDLVESPIDPSLVLFAFEKDCSITFY